MINIRPVSDLKNNIKQYSAIINDIEHKLDEADEVAEKSEIRHPLFCFQDLWKSKEQDKCA